MPSMSISMSLRGQLISSTKFSPLFSPLSFFANNEVGVWYEPNDITTLYSGANLNSQITAPGQSVLLMLDKSKGLAVSPTDITINGSFATDTGWAKAGGITIGGGVCTFTNVAANQSVVQSGATQYKLYKVTYTVLSCTSGGFRLLNGSIASTPGTYSETVVATSTTVLSISASANGTTGTITNVICQEVLGNHAVQVTSSRRPIYGVMPYGGIRNFAVGSAGVSNATFYPASATSNGITITKVATGNDVDGLPYVDLSVVGTASAVSFFDFYAFANSRISAALGQTFTTSMFVQVISGTVPPAGCGAVVGVIAETAPSTITENNASTQFAPSTETLVSLSATLSNAASNQARLAAYIRTDIGATVNYTIRVKGLQFEKSSSRTAFQSSVTKYNVTEVGKSSIGVLYTDGIDDFMVTANIDFTATDKMTVWAGMQKMSDAARGMFAELGNASTGSITLEAPTSAAPNYSFTSSGVGGSSSAIATNYFAPNTAVISGSADISGDTVSITVNNGTPVSSLTDQGTGNYSNNAINLFRRGSSTLPFNGIFSGLIIRGVQSSSQDISSGNIYLNNILGAY